MDYFTVEKFISALGKMPFMVAEDNFKIYMLVFTRQWIHWIRMDYFIDC
jgi:hypothetical protein